MNGAPNGAQFEQGHVGIVHRVHNCYPFLFRVIGQIGVAVEVSYLIKEWCCTDNPHKVWLSRLDGSG